jgi:hypothetical protein
MLFQLILAIPCYISHATSGAAIPFNFTLFHAIPYYSLLNLETAIPCYSTLLPAIPGQAIPCHSTVFHAIPSYSMYSIVFLEKVFHAIPRDAVLFHAVHGNDVLCCSFFVQSCSM